MNNLGIVKFCAEECARQNSGELSVADMYEAYRYAHKDGVELNESLVLALGRMVEPTKNSSGYRNIPVSFANGEVLKANHIPRQMDNLIEHQNMLSANDFYQTFEEIHPFVDGNGRVGAILFNFLNGTLDYPITPPEFKVD